MERQPNEQLLGVELPLDPAEWQVDSHFFTRGPVGFAGRRQGEGITQFYSQESPGPALYWQFGKKDLP